MIRRPTQRAALRHARRELNAVLNSPLDEAYGVVIRALDATANPLPVDLAQLRKLAKGFNVVAGKVGGEDYQRQACDIVESFLTYIKAAAK